ERPRGATVESWTASTRLLGWWDYHGIRSGEAPEETKSFLASSLTLRGGWNTSLSLGWETYAFDPHRYLNYGIERRIGNVVDTVAWDPPNRINDVYGLIFRLTTPEFTHFSGQLGVNRWEDVGFVEATPVELLRVTAEGNWRPSSQLRVNGRYALFRLDRRRDGTNLTTQQIPRLRLEYQLSRSVFIRLVGEYNSLTLDALRDPRTDEPLFLRTDSGRYAATEPEEDNDLQVDWLFSYQPTPGAVVFAGYGSNLTEPDAFELRHLRRNADVFFIKLSYLFRL
ncbi:MAG: hypothetical protein WD627_00855, partial [Actinomycetota bacterium]